MSAKKVILIGEVEIALDSYVTSGTALLGTKGAGKTYAAKGIAEQLLEHEVPIIVFDPIGRWRFLKIAGEDSKKPRGFKVVVAGGEQPDLPLTPASAAEIVRAAMRENIPLVLDLYDRKLSKADWRRIVQTCFRTILYENKGFRHLFLEETAEFAPQKVMDGETYAEVEKLVRMGGNASVGITLINQRAQEVNKAVLDLCDNLVLMRQRGSHAIEALEKWIDRLDPNSAKTISRAMPTMKAGEAWVFTGSTDVAAHVHTGPIRSFHPDRSKPQLTAEAEAARRADPAEFVTRVSGQLTKLVEESKANDPAELRRQIAELKKKGGGATREEVKAAEQVGFERGQEAGLHHGLRTVATQLRGLKGALHKAVDEAFATDVQQPENLHISIHPPARELKPATRRALEHATRYASREVRRVIAVNSGRSGGGNGAALPIGEAAVLRACIQYPEGLAREQLTVLTGYKRSSRDAYIARLAARGYVTTDGKIRTTDEGLGAIPDAEPLPTGEALQEFWRARLPEGERKILDVLIQANPDPVARDSLDEVTGYKRSSRDAYLARLAAKELVREAGRGMVAASQTLFG